MSVISSGRRSTASAIGSDAYDEPEPDKTLSVVAVGDDKIGKSSLLFAHAIGRSLVEIQPDMVGDANYEMTMLDNMKDYGYLVEWKDMLLKCYSEVMPAYDFIRQSAYDKIKSLPELYENCVVFLCFSLSKLESLESIRYKYLKEVSKSSIRKRPRILVGIKSNTHESVVNPHVIEEFCSESKLLYIEVSPFTYSNVEHLFYVATQLLSQNFFNEYTKASEAVLEAAESEHTVSWRRCKLMVVGEGKAGKSSLIRALLGEPFEEEWISTIGASLTTTTTNVRDDSWAQRNYDMDYTTEQIVRAGMEKYFQLRALENESKGKEHKRNPRKKKSTLQKYGNMARSGIWSFGSTKSKAGKKQSEKKDSLRMRLGNKKASKKRSQKSTKDHAKKEFVRDSIAEKSKKSGKPFGTDRLVADIFRANMFVNMHESVGDDGSGLTLTVYDFGGQDVFHTLHHLFLTKYGVYLVVFSLSTVLENEARSLSNFKFWLSSIQLHAPDAPILIVGTHLGDLKDESRTLVEVEVFLENTVKVGTRFPQVYRTDAGWFTAVDNRTRENISPLRKEIARVANRTAFVHTKISLRWTKVLDEMISFSRKDKDNTQGSEIEAKPEHSSSWLELDTVKDIATKYGVREDVDKMLSMFHEFGVLIHLTATDALRNIVVIDPQWILQKIGLVIRDKDAHKSFYDLKRIKKLGLKTDLKSLLKSGIVSKDLLEFFWNQDQFRFVLDFMEHTLLLSRWEFGSIKRGGKKKVSEKYLVPSMLPLERILSKVPTGRNSSEFAFDFSQSYLPAGVFQRLLCLYTAHSARSNPGCLPILYQREACLWFGTASVVIRHMEDDRISFFLVEHESLHPAELLSLTLSMFQKVNEDAMHGRLKWEITLNGESRIPFSEAKQRKLKPWFDDKSCLLSGKNSSPQGIDLDSFFDKLS